jgi:hypothetical protein
MVLTSAGQETLSLNWSSEAEAHRSIGPRIAGPSSRLWHGRPVRVWTERRSDQRVSPMSFRVELGAAHRRRLERCTVEQNGPGSLRVLHCASPVSTLSPSCPRRGSAVEPIRVAARWGRRASLASECATERVNVCSSHAKWMDHRSVLRSEERTVASRAGATAILQSLPPVRHTCH